MFASRNLPENYAGNYNLLVIFQEMRSFFYVEMFLMRYEKTTFETLERLCLLGNCCNNRKNLQFNRQFLLLLSLLKTSSKS